MSEEGIPKMPEFNPSNYKSYEDLPDVEKKNFVPTQDGGFISKEMAWQQKRFQSQSEMYNRRSRSFLQKILGRGKKTAMDFAHEAALERNLIENAKIEIRKIRESMPEELKKELEEALFEGREDVNYHTSGEGDPISVKGLDGAIGAAINAGGQYSWDTDWATVELKYKGVDTDAEVLGVSNGWERARPSVKINHKGQDYSWVETF